MKFSSLHLFMATFVVCVLRWAPAATAQNALGDGTALDANLQVGSNGVNPQQPTPSFNAGNDVITGNVPGLGYFHGEVGYTALNEFRGRLSGDDLFRFRAQSLSSGLAPSFAGNYGGLAQEQTRVYRALSGVNLSNLPPNSSYNANTTSGLVVQTQQAGYATSPRLQGPATWSGLNANTYQRRIGAIQQSNGRLLEFSVSPLLGMRSNETQRLSPKSFTSKPGLEDTQSTTTSRAITPDQPPLGLIEAIQFDQPTKLSPRLVGQIHASLFAPLQSTRTKPSQEVYLDLLAQIKERSRTVQTLPLEDDADPDTPQDSPQEDDDPSSQTSEPPTENSALNQQLERLLGTLDYELPDLTTLAGTQNDFAGKLARQAQDKLRARQYLDAEERYRQLLRIQPDDPMARVGLIHSQIGAGLIRSAQFNLRALLKQHPELIAARYDAPLLPDNDRMQWARDELMRMVELSPRPDPALLLAYIAYHNDSPKLIGYALNLANERGLNNGLAMILQRVWLDEGKPQTTPVLEKE